MKFVLAAATAAAMFAAIPANADILVTGSRSGNYSNTTVQTETLVPINGTFSSVTFSTSSPNQIVRITYNAECGIASSISEDYLAVIIKVDGVEASPASGNQFALCTATSAAFAWVGAVRQSTIKIPHSGSHKVQVYGWMYGTGTWWLGDSSVVVDR